MLKHRADLSPLALHSGGAIAYTLSVPLGKLIHDYPWLDSIFIMPSSLEMPSV